MQDRAVYRVIDANINRAKEGLRVCEEITRFILNDARLSSGFKKLRHNLSSIISQGFPKKETLMKQRDSSSDIGRNIYIHELKRDSIEDVFFANLQRVKESLRVLEEFSKLIQKNSAVKFKQVRYDIYELEKKSAQKIAHLRHHR